MEKVTENTFSKGRNSDVDPRKQSAETYSSVKNMSLTANGDFFALKNIKGNKEIKELIASIGATSYNILGAFECRGTFSSYGSPEINPAITIFSKVAPNVDRIQVYDIKRATLHNVFTGDLNFPIDGTIDGFLFGEKNVNKIYWDDHVNTLREIDVTDATIPNVRFLTVRPYAPVDPITFVQVQEGSGQNASGTYQIAYQYFNTVTKKYTTASLFTNPIPIYPSNINDVVSLDEIYGGVPNEVTSKSIVVSVAATPANTQNFDSIRLIVIKNINGQKSVETTAYVTTPSIEWFNNPSNIVYDGSGIEELISLSDVTVEDAPIKNAKTLVVKDNVLFRGNITYDDLTVNQAVFDDAETVTKQIGLSSDIYLPTSSNTNNPSFINKPSGAAGGKTFTDVYGNTVNTEIMRIYDKTEYEFNPLESNYIEPLTFVSGLSIIDGNIFDDDAKLTIPSGIVPGNEFHFKINYDKEALQDFALSTDTGVRSHYYLSSLLGFGFTLPSWLSAIESLLGGGSSSYTNLFADYSYIVQAGDTPTTVASKIATQLNAFGDTSIMEVIASGSMLQFRCRIPRTPGTVVSDRYGIVDIEFWAAKGANTSVVNNTTAITDWQTNPSTSTAGGYKNPLNCVNARSYWREEVYRYGLTYMNEFGNWSRPVPFDFSTKKAMDVVGAAIPVSLITPYTSSTPNRMGLVAIKPSTTTTIQAGDLVLLNPGGYKLVMGVLADGSLLVEILPGETITAATINATRGGKYSFADSGTDWKFPSRSNKQFPMMTNIDSLGNLDENGFINPIGLKITGIRNHPAWAKAFAIVRVKRLKNILWQSPHITAIAAMPSTLEVGFTDGCDTPTDGGDPTGAFGPKVFTKGVAKNLERANAVTVATEDLAARKNQTISRGNIPPIAICVPPDYMYQNQGVNFGDGLFPSGAKLKMVDAVTLFRTSEFDVDGSGADNGDNAGDQLGLAMRADTAGCYYYKDIGGVLSFNSYPFADNIGQFKTGGSEICLDYGQMANRGTQYTFPTQPLPDNFSLKRIIKYGLQPVSFQNCGNEVLHQKSVAILMKSSFGDLTYYSKNSTIPVSNSIALPSFDFAGDTIFYPAPLSQKYNAGQSAFIISGSPDNVNLITNILDGSIGSVPIVNMVRGIEDDRYGKLTDSHQYIFTGVYEVLSGPSDVKTVEVFGGDCFIAKHNVKVSDTTLDRFSPKRVLALADHQEILSLYLESNVNCELQSSQFIYPVQRKVALGPFATDYLYPYHFSYSLENEPKIWLSKSITESNRTVFPARIIYSDQKVFQSDVEGFDRFRALAFHDLPEEYGGITKLIKLASDNVFSIQESGVCVLPINKNVIEDGTGNEMVINSTTLINKEQYILNENGSQHIRSVKASDSNIFFMDARKMEVFKIGGDDAGKISENGMYSSFLADLTSISGIPDKNVVAGYDLNNNEYWIGVNGYNDVNYIVDVNNPGGPTIPVLIPRRTFIHVFSDKINAWTNEISVDASTKINYFVFANSLPYIVGQKAAGNIVLEEVCTGTVSGQILGEVNPSEVIISINPDTPLGKVLDVLRIDSNERLDTLVVQAFKESGVATQTATMSLDIKPRMDGYELPIIKDANKQRLRGKYFIAKFIMNNGDAREIKISGILSKYRLESRIFK
jgi:hypothetical protein